MGRTIAEHLRPALSRRYNFAGGGSDMFGAPTFARPWFAQTMGASRLKADAMFDMPAILGIPFFTFHDRDVVPEGDSLKRFGDNLKAMTDVLAGKMKASGAKHLWGTGQSLHPSPLHGRGGDEP